MRENIGVGAIELIYIVKLILDLYRLVSGQFLTLKATKNIPAAKSLRSQPPLDLDENIVVRADAQRVP